AALVSHARPFIEFEKVSVTFGRGAKRVQALAETSLDVAEGDFVALVGPSGCGKSTLLKLVGDLMKPSTGYVYV
ncbi:ATP-binding cassette domain-containing protein, partial [Streptococcus pneumoniae]|uniref:ATP-binding cassette domain-containing protein n=1 Tax=Streptococcus pneumoniae TaxID=1313 RepID=UPI0019549F1D